MAYTGLTSAEADATRARTGANEIPAPKERFLKKLLHFARSPISLMFLGVLFLTWYAGRTFDFYLVLVLAFLNFFIGFWQEKKADRSIESVQERLAVSVRTFRDGGWRSLDSRALVPGDVVEMGVGDLVPADLEILDAVNVSVNEASLTGESLPKEKKKGDRAFSGSFVVTGLFHATVTATGVRTEFGKTLMLVERAAKRSALEADILSVSRMLSFASLVVIAVFTVVFVFRHEPIADLVFLNLSLLIAGIPISLPTVMSVIIALGVAELAKKGAVTRRLSSLEDLANVDLLLTDKTGTLTKNELAIARIVSYGRAKEDEVLALAATATGEGTRSAIEALIAKSAAARDLPQAGTVTKFIPADSERKRSTAFVDTPRGALCISLGAVAIVAARAVLSPTAKKRLERDLRALGEAGFRALAVARKGNPAKEEKMELVGLIAFADALRPEAADVLAFMHDEGVGVKMVTGDSRAVSRKVATDLRFEGALVNRDELAAMDWESTDPSWLSSRGVFSEVLPADKLHLVGLAKREYTVAVTGDGVNDLPALKAADVGIAVANAVTALKSAADIVLLLPGIQAIRDAFLEARKVFARLYVYSVYRISESFRVIVTIAVLGILYGTYPLSPLQLIILALLNDIPIISLAFNRVKTPRHPAKIHPKKRLLLSSLFGLAGVANSLILFFVLVNFTNLGADTIQTIYFLKLTISGHMLIYVAHTKERWWKFLPSRGVILATTLTQLVASAFAFFGVFMGAISLPLILMVWVWSFFWMQASEYMKTIPERFEQKLS